MLFQGFNLSPPPHGICGLFLQNFVFLEEFSQFFQGVFTFLSRNFLICLQNFRISYFAFLYFTRVNEMRKKRNFYETIYLETLVWKPQYGNPSMETLVWKPQYGNLSMETLVWKPSYGNPSMETLVNTFSKSTCIFKLTIHSRKLFD